jgi:hypothetical protein
VANDARLDDDAPGWGEQAGSAEADPSAPEARTPGGAFAAARLAGDMPRRFGGAQHLIEKALGLRRAGGADASWADIDVTVVFDRREPVGPLTSWGNLAEAAPLRPAGPRNCKPCQGLAMIAATGFYLAVRWSWPSDPPVRSSRLTVRPIRWRARVRQGAGTACGQIGTGRSDEQPLRLRRDGGRIARGGDRWQAVGRLAKPRRIDGRSAVRQRDEQRRGGPGRGDASRLLFQPGPAVRRRQAGGQASPDRRAPPCQ